MVENSTMQKMYNSSYESAIEDRNEEDKVYDYGCRWYFDRWENIYGESR